jgi:hypothetical protein
VGNGVVYIPQGTSGTFHLKWNNSTKVHDGFTETPSGTNGLADGFFKTNDPADGPQSWRWNNNANTGSGGPSTVSRANLIVSGAAIAWNTALTFKTAINAGDSSYKINGLAYKDRTLYVFKNDGPGVVVNDQFTKLETGQEDTPDPANGRAVLAHQQFIYYSWGHSLIRMYGSSHDDIGQDYRSYGLPDGREGEFSDLARYISLLFCAVDAGESGTSSVLAWDGLAWHEMVRAPEEGRRIRFSKPQVCFGTRNRLWTGTGGDLIFQEMPLKKAAPRLDSGARYMHEFVLESAAIDMGTASAMPKFVKELTATIKNLNAQGREAYVDYQFDDAVHTTAWIPAGVATASPESTIFFGLENIRRFAYRLRAFTNDNSVPIDLEGAVPNGYARTPFKMLFTFQVQAGGVSRRGQSVPSDELMRWLLDSARYPYRVKMRSVYHLAHNWHVIIHPARMFPYMPQKGRQGEKANMTLVLQEV